MKEKTKKTIKIILKISAALLAFVLIGGVGIFANSLVGNPLSKALAKSTAEKYIEENYATDGYELEEIKYSFKDGFYHAVASSPNSIDGSFTLLINGFGKLRYDNYEYDVTSGWNTASRIGADYRDAVDVIFDSRSFPYNVHIGYGDLIFVPIEQKDAPETPDYALITNELTVDAYYDATKLGARAGKLTVYIDNETVSAEHMAEILLDIRKCFDDAGVGFYAIDCVLEHPKDENGYLEDGRVEVMDFLYADIYEEGLVERVKEADNAAKEYYAVLDSEKLAEENS